MKNLFSIILILLFACFSSQSKNSALIEAKKLVYVNPEQAIKKADSVMKNTNSIEIKTAAMITIINAQLLLGQSKKVIDNCNKVIIWAKESKEPFQEIKLLSMLGNQYQTMLMTENAKIYLDKAENKMDSIKVPDSLLFLKGNLYNMKGMVFRDELNCEFALKYFEKALKVYEIQRNDKLAITNQALINIQKGSCLIAQGDLDKAEECFNKVINSNFNLGNNRYFALISLAEIFIKKGMLNQADDILKNVPIKELEENDSDLSSQFYSTIISLSLAMDNVKDYNMYLSKYLKYSRIAEQNQAKKIDSFIYDSDIKNKESLNKNQKYQISFYLLFSLFLILLLFSIWKRHFQG
ncbi:hypothetical protein BBI01_17810 [Chryseobacterium artocarpi]|uniref:MalT-like TPR region domain-containing protein n=1 Tax=Chryseobacterium artocarpi TaxID=1414727 RepID=A0A1B8ZBR9_9FLAO|nr:tetratricopeptide repeat protein [Chryseobacterium artocarpi]OCA69068.1 hypothetical protein BBI01_17810 [Chryseobacterium artocarpi]